MRATSPAAGAEAAANGGVAALCVPASHRAASGRAASLAQAAGRDGWVEGGCGWVGSGGVAAPVDGGGSTAAVGKAQAAAAEGLRVWPSADATAADTDVWSPLLPSSLAPPSLTSPAVPANG